MYPCLLVHAWVYPRPQDFLELNSQGGSMLERTVVRLGRAQCLECCFGRSEGIWFLAFLSSLDACILGTLGLHRPSRLFDKFKYKLRSNSKPELISEMQVKARSKAQI